MPEEAIAPAQPKPVGKPSLPENNGALRADIPPRVAMTLKDLGLAFNQTGELEGDAANIEAPAPKFIDRGRSIGDFVDETREARKKKTAENGNPKPNEAESAKVEQTNSEPGAQAGASVDAAAPKVEDPKPVEVVKKQPVEDVIRATVDQAMSRVEERLAKPAVSEAKAAGVLPDAYEASLGEVEKEELALARFAADKLPDRYSDRPAKLIEFFRKHDAYVQRASKEDPERTFDDRDEDLQKFVADNKPRFQASDRRKLERMQITEEVTAKVAEQTRADTEVLRASQHKLEVRPVIEKTVQTFKDELDAKLKPKEDEPEPIKKLRAPIVKAVQETAVKRMAEYVALDMRATKFDADKPDHAWLLDFVRQQGAWFAQNGGEARNRGDKTFLPLEQFRKLERAEPEKTSNHWTFGFQEIKDMIAYQAEMDASALLKQESDRRLAEGWEPIKTAVPKKEDIKKQSDEPNPQPSSSPKATGSASPGAGNPGPSLQPHSALGPLELRTLGVKLPA